MERQKKKRSRSWQWSCARSGHCEHLKHTQISMEQCCGHVARIFPSQQRESLWWSPQIPCMRWGFLFAQSENLRSSLTSCQTDDMAYVTSTKYRWVQKDSWTWQNSPLKVAFAEWQLKRGLLSISNYDFCQSHEGDSSHSRDLTHDRRNPSGEQYQLWTR